MFGTEGSTFFAQESRLFVVGRFTDGLGQRPLDTDPITGAVHPIMPAYRPQKIYGTGRTWDEAFKRAKLAIGAPQ